MTAAILRRKTPLGCRLGRHRSDALAQWNHGFYFAKCRRCGCDLVRTAYGRWHEPRGFRVVWRSSPPENAVAAPAPAKASARDADELPIQEVLRHLHNEEIVAAQAEGIDEEIESAAEPEPEPEPEPESVAAQPPAPPGRKSGIADFMDEPVDTSWPDDPPPRIPDPEPAPPQAPQPAAAEPTVEERAAVPSAPLFEPPFAQLAASVISTPPEPVKQARPTGPNGRRYGLAAGGLFLLLVAGLAGRETISFAESGASLSSPQPVALGAGQPAYITVGDLSCRDGPALEAMPVRRLVRGDVVRLIARDGDWASLSYQGGQCWTPLRYLSIEPPI